MNLAASIRSVLVGKDADDLGERFLVSNGTLGGLGLIADWYWNRSTGAPAGPVVL